MTVRTCVVIKEPEETMRQHDRRQHPLLRLAAIAACILLGVGSRARAGDVTVPGTTDFPESMTAASDGTLYFSGLGGGEIFRAAPGQSLASEWIKQGTNGLDSALGVLADDKTNTLYVCSSDLSKAGVKMPTGITPTALKLFDLKTGAPKASIPLPPSTLLGQTSLCNDIALASDGTAYVTDSLAGHILRLKPGATSLEIWAHDPRWDVKGAQLDGIVVLPDGVYANIFEGNGLYRVSVNPDGSAGKITKLETSRPLYHSDGLRAYGPDKLLMVEGATKGNLDMITISGDKAKIDTIKGGFGGPVSLVQVGDTVYVLNTELKYLFDASLRGQKPPPFTAYAVKLAQ
jgi:sugar lactone lactonase YvrE